MLMQDKQQVEQAPLKIVSYDKSLSRYLFRLKYLWIFFGDIWLETFDESCNLVEGNWS